VGFRHRCFLQPDTHGVITKFAHTSKNKGTPLRNSVPKFRHGTSIVGTCFCQRRYSTRHSWTVSATTWTVVGRNKLTKLATVDGQSITLAVRPPVYGTMHAMQHVARAHLQQPRPRPCEPMDTLGTCPEPPDFFFFLRGPQLAVVK